MSRRSGQRNRSSQQNCVASMNLNYLIATVKYFALHELALSSMIAFNPLATKIIINFTMLKCETLTGTSIATQDFAIYLII